MFAPAMSEGRLWAPWRLEYIKGGPKADDCVFCVGSDASDDARRYVVHRGEEVFSILNAYPYANGHLMVAPYGHVPSIEQLDEAALLELMTETRAALGALRRAYGPDGFNMGINEGQVAGAGFEDHLHLHVVPRWGGDNNYMPVIADTRVLPQSLEDSYAALSAAWPR
jgi:ATP adenylyltransferase